MKVSSNGTIPLEPCLATAVSLGLHTGLSKVRLLTNNPKKVDAFVIHGHGLEVVDQVPIIAPDEANRRRYLAAPRDALGHLLPDPADNGPEARTGPGAG